MEYIPDRQNKFFDVNEMPSVEDFAAHNHSVGEDRVFQEWYETTTGYGLVRDRLIQYCCKDVTILASIMKVFSNYIYEKIAPIEVLFAESICTLAKCSMYMWLHFNYEHDEDGEKEIELYAHYRFNYLWTSDLAKIFVSSLQANNQLLFYDPCMGVFLFDGKRFARIHYCLANREFHEGGG